MYPEKISSALDFERALAVDEARALAQAEAWARSGHLARLLAGAGKGSRLWAVADAAGYDEEGRPPVPGDVDDFAWDALRKSWERTKPLPPEPEAVPEFVHRHKFLGLMAQRGVSKEMLAQGVAASLEDGPDKLQALNELNEAPVFRRYHTLVDAVGPGLGYDTVEKKDQFFRDAQAYVFGEGL